MARNEKGHAWFIGDRIIKQLEEKKERLSKIGSPMGMMSITALIQWTLDSWSQDKFDRETKVKDEHQAGIIQAAGAERSSKSDSKRKAS